jgi:hypothetical protein
MVLDHRAEETVERVVRDQKILELVEANDRQATVAFVKRSRHVEELQECGAGLVGRRARRPEHEHGRHKARVFASALGIDRDDWEYLRDKVADKIRHADVSEIRTGGYGVRYSVAMLIEGLNGETHEVTTGWIIEEEDAAPRLTTAYVNVP